MAQGKDSGRRRALAEALAPFSIREFRVLWTGQAVSAAGGGMTKVALLFAVLAVDGSVTDIGLVMTAQVTMQVLFTLAGGVWADRLPRQFLMLASDLIRAAAQLVLATLLLTGHAEVWHLIVGSAVFGAAQAFFGPASSGLMAEIVPPEQLQRSNALLSFCNSAFTVLSPALAGVVIALWGPGLVLAIDAVTFIVSAVSLGMLRLAPRTVPAPESFLGDLRTGWREFVIRPWLWLNLIAHMLQNLAVAAYYVLGPAIADKSLGGPSAWGAIVAGWAAGAIAGGFIALKLEPRRPLIVGNLALILTALPLLALAVPTPLWTVVGTAFLSGAATMFLDALWQASMQQMIPAEVLSRVDSYDWMLSTLAAPLGLALVGPLAAQTGNAQTLLIAAAMIVIPCGLTPLVPGIRAVRRSPDGVITGPPVKQPAQV
ncbi:MFS transporter [Streptomyces atratus]|uniref:MFS transporter n=1 Tax=Streptomyces atratus TaxID=1893 RepID=A0A2Z5J6E6_STRAR|nr:MFS transporter [Streptomyces atratus]AXE75896.1 MFS transporter [Streptomyces atratus]WPW26744.1 MFS transporter [Streptomyces atratus]GGT44228.1 MFS transporter [Streptomyces atratus]